MTNEDFVKKYMEAYNEGHNLSWVAEELGVAASVASTKKKLLREAGVNLPDLKKVKAPVDADSLNNLIDQLK